MESSSSGPPGRDHDGRRLLGGRAVAQSHRRCGILLVARIPSRPGRAPVPGRLPRLWPVEPVSAGPDGSSLRFFEPLVSARQLGCRDRSGLAAPRVRTSMPAASRKLRAGGSAARVRAVRARDGTPRAAVLRRGHARARVWTGGDAPGRLFPSPVPGATLLGRSAGGPGLRLQARGGRRRSRGPAVRDGRRPSEACLLDGPRDRRILGRRRRGLPLRGLLRLARLAAVEQSSLAPEPRAPARVRRAVPVRARACRTRNGLWSSARRPSESSC